MNTTVLETATHKIVVVGNPKDISKKLIRRILTSTMQRRFTIPEEMFIASDPAAAAIKVRLLNDRVVDLDFQDTIDCVTEICAVLEAGGMLEEGVTADIRKDKLLIDGDEGERYS